MTAKSSSALAFAALLANLAFVATGCGVFGAEDAPSTPGDQSSEPAPSRDNGDIKGTPVGGPASTSELTDALGVFVAPAAPANGDGTHTRPLTTIQAGIDLAKRVGKRVYVCAGTFHEALVIADSISVIGGLDCTANDWRTGAARTRIESPSSPAVLAANITTATRLENLEIIAPNAIQPSGSSIGLLGKQASALTIASTKIVSGDGMKGDDGVEGIQLANDATAKGGDAPASAKCVVGVGPCFRSAPAYDWVQPEGGARGLNTCVGAPGHEAQQGGFGGSGGLYEVFFQGPIEGLKFRPYSVNVASPGVHNRTSAPGANGNDGTSGTTGSISDEGYVPADGTPGTDGATGFAGAGGDGHEPFGNPPAGSTEGMVFRGWGGAGGGAGGCPGLAGTAGKGGGASIAVLLIESPIRFDAVELLARQGGAGGLGTFGSSPTRGGASGQVPSEQVALVPTLAAQPGGRGGAAGISGNGSSGPSAAIAHVGAAPEIRGVSSITPGTGGAAIDARSRTDGFGITKAIPATPAGLSKDILAL